MQELLMNAALVAAIAVILLCARAILGEFPRDDGMGKLSHATIALLLEIMVIATWAATRLGGAV